MERIVKYSILRAVPDKRRGETVNVGMVAFLPDRLDVRFAELGKLRALTGQDWESYATSYLDGMNSIFDQCKGSDNLFDTLAHADTVFGPTEMGWFRATSDEDYEQQIKEVMAALVLKQKVKIAAKKTGINTELAKSFKAIKALASKEEGIDSKKIVREYTVSAEDNLVADFAWKNGKLNFAATLDLRSGGVLHGTAALKAITLDKAQTQFGGDQKVNRIGIYAVAPSMELEHRAHLSLLKDYSDTTFNWALPGDQKKFLRYMSDSMNLPFFGLN